MRVKPKQKIQALKSSDRQVEVSRIVGDMIMFKVFFEADPIELIDSKINFCEFKVYDERKNLINKVKTKALSSSSALHKATPRKTAAKDSSDQVVVRGTIDVTKSIPNDRITLIAAGEPARRRKKLTFTQESDVGALRLISSEAIEQNTKDSVDLKSSHKATLNRKLRDPAAEVNIADFHAPAINAARGIRTTSDKSKLDPKQLATRNAMVKSSTSTRGSILEDEELSTIEIELPIRMRKSQARKLTVEITARAPSVVGQFGRPLQTIKSVIDFRRAYENHIIPTMAPQLQFTSVGTQRLMRIKQVDKNGSSIAVFRKNTQSPTGPGGREYKKIASISLKFGQETQIFDRPGQLGKSIYRVVPYNELSITSGEFSSAVAPGSHVVRQREEPDEVTLLAYETGGGIQVSIFNVPNDVVAVRLLRRNITINESTFSIPSTVKGGPQRSFEKLTSDIKMIDRPSRVDSAYEYKAILINSRGEEKESLRSCFIHFSGNSQDQEGYTFSTSAPKVSNGSVTFQVDAPTNQASLDLVYNLLSSQGLESQYASEIANNKQLLSKLVALEMLRFDTVTGLNESFGIIQTGIFNDNSSSQRAVNVSPLTQGRRYIYQYRLLIRSPGTIFNNSKIQSVDLETGKSYTTDQKKFNSPKTLKAGTLASNARQVQAVTKGGLKFDAASSSAAEMIAGRTALTGQFEVTVPFSDTSLSNPTVESTTRGNVIRWDINQGMQKIDHVIVYADYNGKLAPLRSLHFHGNTKMLYLDDRLKASVDEVKYYLQIVFDDFTHGQQVGPAVEFVDAS